MKITAQPAFVLHSQAYKETSLLVEVLTRDYGRISLVARGARRPRADIRGALLPFAPLTVDWFGKTELKTLASVDWLGGQPQLSGTALLSGFYLNELLMRLLAKEDPHTRIFRDYAHTIQALAERRSTIPVVLRRFEYALLVGLGYAPLLTVEADGITPIHAARDYLYRPSHGAIPRPAHLPRACPVSGETLLAIARDDFSQPRIQAEAKTLLRALLAEHLNGATLTSREILDTIQRCTMHAKNESARLTQ